MTNFDEETYGIFKWAFVKRYGSPEVKPKEK